MLKIVLIVATIVLVLHGLIHLMGTVAYLQLGVIQQLPYKTTVLGGRWDLGAGGIAVYGAVMGSGGDWLRRRRTGFLVRLGWLAAPVAGRDAVVVGAHCP